jgi:hypothetical protein
LKSLDAYFDNIGSEDAFEIQLNNSSSSSRSNENPIEEDFINTQATSSSTNTTFSVLNHVPKSDKQTQVTTILCSSYRPVYNQSLASSINSINQNGSIQTNTIKPYYSSTSEMNLSGGGILHSTASSELDLFEAINSLPKNVYDQENFEENFKFRLKNRSHADLTQQDDPADGQNSNNNNTNNKKLTEKTKSCSTKTTNKLPKFTRKNSSENNNNSDDSSTSTTSTTTSKRRNRFN